MFFFGLRHDVYELDSERWHHPATYEVARVEVPYRPARRRLRETTLHGHDGL